MRSRKTLLISLISTLMLSGCDLRSQLVNAIANFILDNNLVSLTNSSDNNLNLSTSGESNTSTTSSTYSWTTSSTQTTITHTSTNSTTSVTSSTTSQIEQKQAAWSIFIYMCGSDLESGSGLATTDIKEILSVANQPDDVNIVIQTGGAKTWKYSGISSSYTQRWHVQNKKLVKDSESAKANMGLSATLSSFLTWGLQTYPADKTGLIFWNHGGGMDGVCYDENYSNDSLTNAEVKTALKNTFNTINISSKLEFVGYDACLMQVQDIADFNSEYFNYMIASEESEAGEGWDYDNWIDDIYAKKDTKTILTAICDSFIDDWKNSEDYGRYDDIQTLSYLDLSYASEYRNAWEQMATNLSSKLSSNNISKTTFKNFLKSCKYFGEDDNDYYPLFDAKDFINKIASKNYSPDSQYLTTLTSILNNYISYYKNGSDTGKAYGLAFPFGYDSQYGLSNYNTNNTNFTNWRSLMSTYGVI